MEVRIQDLKVAYDGDTVLEVPALKVSAGRMTGILGPNGAGKSTLFKAVLGLLPTPPEAARFDGQPLDKLRAAVAYVPQRDEVDWSFPATVLDIVLMGRHPHRPWYAALTSEDRRLAEAALQELGIADLARRQIGALSGGQQQRMFIARALCQKPRLLMLDEPFVGVDNKTEQRIVDILRKFTQGGHSVLMIHHDLGKVRDYFDELVLLNRKVVAAGPVAEVFTPSLLSETYGGVFASL